MEGRSATRKSPAALASIPDLRAAISAVNAETNRARLIVIRPPESGNLAVDLAVELISRVHEDSHPFPAFHCCVSFSPRASERNTGIAKILRSSRTLPNASMSWSSPIFFTKAFQ